MKTQRYLLTAVWFVVLGVLLIMTRQIHHGTHRFPGLAKSVDEKIDFNYPLKILSMRVHEGSHVALGDLLCTVQRTDLLDKRDAINAEIERIETDFRLFRQKMQAQIHLLEMREIEEITPLKNRLAQLRHTLALNRTLLRTIDPSITLNTQNSNAELSSILARMRIAKKRYALQKELLKKELDTREKSVVAQLQKRYDLRAQLYRLLAPTPVYAAHEGIVTQLLYLPGNSVPAFSAILTIKSDKATFVEGYIPEDEPNDLKIGSPLTIAPVTKYADQKPIVGRVVDLGSRILPLPEHLKRYPTMALWGYKVIVSLPDNAFKIDQKVILSLPKRAREGVFQTLRAWMDHVLG